MPLVMAKQAAQAAQLAATPAPALVSASATASAQS